MDQHRAHTIKGHYASFAIELAIDFVIMFFVMYAMIATLDHLYININNAYMTLMMIAPMSVVMLVTMRSMFTSRWLNWIIGVTAVIVFAVSFVAMRTQAVVGNEQFLRAMIPHHSGAILMCEKASISDPAIIALCAQIIPGQREEIRQMQEILKRY